MTNEEIIKGLQATTEHIGKHFNEGGAWMAEFIDDAIKALEQQRWIPVSEGLPKIVEWYSTSIKCADGTERVTISWFDGVSFKAEVKAWMPLPRPYKEEQDEKNNTDND